MLAAKQPDRALPCWEQALTLARTVGDRFAERIVLERLGTLLANRGDLPRAIDLLTQALALTRTLGLRRNEPDLLWFLAIQHAALGQRERAIASAQTAVHLLGQLNKPEARVYAESLERFRQAEAGVTTTDALGQAPGESTAATTMASLASSASSAPLPRTGSSHLWMAISAGKALVRFLGSGLKTATAETLRGRLQQCDACRYYIKLRCRVCGCFIHLKARLPHEECLLGQWSAELYSRANHGGNGNPEDASVD
jgi:tetratricopeptide (TPR) repeat protein